MSDLIKDCLFCKIIRGDVPSYTVFENDDVKAFFWIFPKLTLDIL